jgi:hypothetical protein
MNWSVFLEWAAIGAGALLGLLVFLVATITYRLSREVL